MNSQKIKLFRNRIILQPFDGEEVIFLDIDEILHDVGWQQNANQRLEIYAEVTEARTDSRFNDTASVDLVRSPIKVEALQKPEVIKPGLLYQALVSGLSECTLLFFILISLNTDN